MNRGIIESENFGLALLLLNRALCVLCRFYLLVFRASRCLSGSDWRRDLAGLALPRFLRRHSLFMHEYLILEFLRLLLSIRRCLIRYLILNG